MGVRKVLVVGGGIVGPVLAMFLRRLGVEVTIAERRARLDRVEGAFLGVAPNGMNVLAELGLAEAVTRQGVPCRRFRFRNAAGEEIGLIDRKEDPERFGWPLTMIRRRDLHQLLMEEARARDVRVQLGQTLVGLADAPTGWIQARFQDGTTLEADLVVGGDGQRSAVRTLTAPLAQDPVSSGLWDCGGFVRGVEVPLAPGDNEMLFGREAFFGAFPIPEGEVWWFHNGPEGTSADSHPERLRERLLHLHREDPPWVRQLISATPELLGPWTLSELPSLPGWSHGRVCLIGDAAHAMSPSAGQGASLAMEDAMVLAMCLRDVADPAGALKRYETLRRDRVETIARHARRSSSGKAVQNRLALAFRDLMLPFFLRMGGPAQDRAYAHLLDWTANAGSTLGGPARRAG